MIYEGSGRALFKASAVWMTTGLGDTQQVCVDNSIDNGMRAAVGAMVCKGHARIIR